MPKPRALKSGDIIGVISPASGVDQASLGRGLRLLESLGFKVKLGEISRKLYEGGMLSAPDEVRARELQWAFGDDEIAGIIAGAGGYGTLRLLDKIDYKLIAANPKVLVGFSDLTALLNSIYKLTQLVVFHGPMVAIDFGQEKPSNYTIDWFKRAVMQPSPLEKIEQPEGAPPVKCVVEGEGRGKIIGGNLTLLVRLLGTRFEPDFSGKIVIIEEVGEDPYEIDGMLTQLILHGGIKNASGIVFSQCVDCPVPERAGRPINRITLEAVIKERLEKIGVPSIYNFNAGHNVDKPTLPIGVEAKLDAYRAELRIIESATAE